MEFYRPKKKAVNVPIIPLIDILVTLLFFFIVSMAPKQRRSLLEVSLPEANTLKTRSATHAVSVLSVNGEGAFDLDGLEVPAGLLKEYLTANRQEAAEAKLEIRMDRACTVETLLAVQGAVQNAGYAKGEVFHRVRKDEEGSQEEVSN
ncbi:MAG: ExbD/TolR family protein [Verrucomicrobiales bacterium]